MTAYRIVVQGELGGTLAAAFENLAVDTASGQTVLSGEIADQAQLHGVLERLRDFGIELVSVVPADPPEPPGEATGR